MQQPPRWRFRFSLRALLLVCGVMAVLVLAPRYRTMSQRYAAKVLQQRGFQLKFADHPKQSPWSWLVYGDSHYHYVHEIAIEGKEIRNADVTMMRQFPVVKTIAIRDCPSSPVLLKRIAEFRWLLHLDVIDSPITNEHVIELAKLDLGSLTVINPRHGNLELSRIASERNRGLQNLTLHGQAIDDATLVEVSKLTGLRSLYISNALVTDEGLRPLSSLCNLILLDIHRCPINGSTLDGFSVCTELKELNLASCRINSAAITRISQIRGLTWVDLRSTDVTKEDTLKLQKAIPCYVWSDF